ncbi:hypothetical protein ACRALDRAFT_1076138 [Sodiomyces alcalophilus JCM 7366]|uniref:uncharacterized protein n=1 Tax=Sodiomyces alcalophilus JCM 7366 TaxID=591952 RepID=UPI0039B58A65
MALRGTFSQAYTRWLSLISQCCAPLSACLDDKADGSPATTEEKRSVAVLRDQPAPVSMPMSMPFAGPRQDSCQRETRRLAAENESPAGFGSPVTERCRSSPAAAMATTLRRPQISGPSDFRRLDSESFHFPQYTHLQRVSRRPPLPPDFRPIELSIRTPGKQLSPILPLFEFPSTMSLPPSAHVPGKRDDDCNLGPDRSYSPMSFHVPRKPTASPPTLQDELPPKIPPKSRARAYTSPNIERMKERIAYAMIEVEKLQREIDSVMERQSVGAANSRPSTAYSMTPLDMEPMPSIPALPPAAPSFAERLSTDRPQTAPSVPSAVRIPCRAKTFAEASAAFITPPPSRGSEDQPLPPPLPLVLRPPLRKKKSFSRVSSWLFPSEGGSDGQQHQRQISLDSVTNLPRPIKGREGFYQCVAPGGQTGRQSFETLSTVPTWETDEDEDEDGSRTVHTTTWSPGSTPVTKPDDVTTPLERVATFGRDHGHGGMQKGSASPRRGSVGVAF